MRLLDLFCGAGGAAEGYFRAGFTEIVGVDLRPQPRYPFTFVRADALEFLASFGSGFDVIHASPPCQCYTAGRRAQRRVGDNPHPDLIGRTRTLLRRSGRAYVIENVEGSPLERPIRLCGQAFSALRVIRHRLFESSVSLVAPVHQKHTGSMLDGTIVAVYGGKWLVSGGARKGETTYKTYGRIPVEFRRLPAKQAAMGIHWMTGRELEEAVPPAYTEFIGEQLLSQLVRPPQVLTIS